MVDSRSLRTDALIGEFRVIMYFFWKQLLLIHVTGDSVGNVQRLVLWGSCSSWSMLGNTVKKKKKGKTKSPNSKILSTEVVEKEQNFIIGYVSIQKVMHMTGYPLGDCKGSRKSFTPLRNALQPTTYMFTGKESSRRTMDSALAKHCSSSPPGDGLTIGVS